MCTLCRSTPTAQQQQDTEKQYGAVGTDWSLPTSPSSAAIAATAHTCAEAPSDPTSAAVASAVAGGAAAETASNITNSTTTTTGNTPALPLLSPSHTSAEATALADTLVAATHPCVTCTGGSAAAAAGAEGAAGGAGVGLDEDDDYTMLPHRVHLFWMCRSAAEFSWFNALLKGLLLCRDSSVFICLNFDVLNDAMRRCHRHFTMFGLSHIICVSTEPGVMDDPRLEGVFEVSTFMTGEVDLAAPAIPATHAGRPNWPRIFGRMQVRVCGFQL